MAVPNPLPTDVLEIMKVEYTEAGEFYRHTYATIWQSGSILIASAFVVVGFLIQSRQVMSALTLIPIALIVFWWLGIFEPMNRYADWRLRRASQIECYVGGLAQFRQSRYVPKLNRVFLARSSCDRVWKAWPYGVRCAVRVGILFLALLLAVASNLLPVGAILGFVFLFIVAMLLKSEWRRERCTERPERVLQARCACRSADSEASPHFESDG
jgi:uncharacterized SAM-binding protein YcdF (DUF218 family)